MDMTREKITNETKEDFSKQSIAQNEKRIKALKKINAVLEKLSKESNSSKK